MKWGKIIGWTLAGLFGLVVVVVAVGYFYLKTSSFQQFAIRKIVERADESTGGHTQIRALDFDLSTLTVNLCGVVIRGKEPSDAAPLFQVDKLTVGVNLHTLLHRRLTLSELRIEHPVVRLRIDRQGNSNLPQAPADSSSSHTNVFDLAVGHTLLSNGEIGYNDRSTSLDANLFDLSTDVRFDSLATLYRGAISYDTGQLRYGEYQPLPHALKASFTAKPADFHLNSADITLASSSIQLSADLSNYGDPVVQGNYKINLHTQDAAALVPSLHPAGDVALTGSFHYKNVEGRALLANLRIDGELDSEALAAAVSTGRVEVKNLHAHYLLADASLRANGIGLETLGGKVRADVDVDHLAGTPASHVKAELRGISLSAMQRALRTRTPVTVSGLLDGTADAAWTGSVSNARARVDLLLRSGSAKVNSSGESFPVDGVVHALYDAPANSLTLRETSLSTPAATITAQGQLSKHSQLQINASASDLNRVMELVAAVHPFAGGTPAVGGSATVNATVQGELQRPQIVAQVNAQDLEVQGSEWKSAGLTLKANPSLIVVSNGTLMNARRGQTSFNATVGLHDWAYLPSSPIQAQISLQQMQLADLQHLADVHYPVSGVVSANVALNGSQLAPRGSGSIQLAKAQAYDEPLKAVALTFHGDDNSIISALHLGADAGTMDANFTYMPKAKSYTVKLTAPAIVLQKLRAVKGKNLGLAGTLEISANGAGTIDDPQLTASIQLPKLEVKDKSITGVRADLRVANQRADLTLDSEVAQTSVHARAQLQLTGEYQADASIDTGAVPLEVLLDTFSSQVPAGFSGQTEIHATLKGPLKNKNLVEAHLTIPTLSAKYQSLGNQALEIGAASPIHADYAHSVITLQPAEIRGTGTELLLQGSVPIAGAGASGSAAANLMVQGTIDARIAQMMSPDLKSSGTVALDIHATGSTASPQIGGQLRLQNIAFATPAAPLGVNNLNGTLDVNSQRVQITSLTGQVGGGEISGSGAITYRPSPRFDLALQAKSVRLLYPAGLRSVLDGNLAWAGTEKASTITGRVLVDSLSFTSDFDISTFSDQFGGSVAPAVPGFADTVQLQIALQSKSNLSATSSQISIEGSAFLNASGTLADPVITGRTDLTSGELFYRNVRYQLQRGIITFNDPNETNPTLDVSVSTTIEQYNLTINLRGPFNKLTTSYTSDPPLATADVINLIARGHTSSELAAQSQSTDSMIASQAASQISGSVQKLVGISALQVDPVFGGSTQTSTRVGIQQRVSKNFLFTFSTDLSQPGQEIVEGDYQINRRWSVTVERDQVGGVSVDGRLHTRF